MSQSESCWTRRIGWFREEIATRVASSFNLYRFRLCAHSSTEQGATCQQFVVLSACAMLCSALYLTLKAHTSWFRFHKLTFKLSNARSWTNRAQLGHLFNLKPTESPAFSLFLPVLRAAISVTTCAGAISHPVAALSFVSSFCTLQATAAPLNPCVAVCSPLLPCYYYYLLVVHVWRDCWSLHRLHCALFTRAHKRANTTVLINKINRSTLCRFRFTSCASATSLYQYNWTIMFQHGTTSHLNALH